MRKFLITLFTIIISINVYAQQKTAYEKKVWQIHNEFFRALNINESLITLANKTGDLSIIQTSSDFNLKTKLIEKSELIALITIWTEKLKAAEKLKTSIDFEREKKEKDLKAKKQLEEKLLQEEARIKENEKRKFDNSDKILLQKNIANDFTKWLNKGEFEKQEDYEKRISNQLEKEFENVCYNKFKERIDEVERNNFEIKLEQYNSESEFFPLTITISGYPYQGNLIVPIDKAQRLKENLSAYSKDFSKSVWFFTDNYLVPDLFYLTNFDLSYKVTLTLPQKEEAEISLSDLKIQNVNNQVHFDYNKESKEYLKAKEKNENERLERKKRQEEFYKLVENGNSNFYNYKDYEKALESYKKASLYVEFFNNDQKILTNIEVSKQQIEYRKTKILVIENHDKILKIEYKKKYSEIFKTYFFAYEHLTSKDPFDYYNGRKIQLYEDIDDFRNIVLNIQEKLLLFEKTENDLLLKKLKDSQNNKEKIQMLNTEL